MRIMQFGDEAAESGQAHGGHAGDDEGDGGEGHDAGSRFIGPSSGELAGVGAVVDHAADDGEEQSGDHAVREHLQHGAGEADLVERHEAEQDEAHVADAGVADDELEVASARERRGRRRRCR